MFIELFRNIKINKIFMVRKYRDFWDFFNIDFLVLKRYHNRQQFLVINIIIKFCRDHFFKYIYNGVPLLFIILL